MRMSSSNYILFLAISMMMSATAAFQCPSTVMQSGTRSALNVGTNFDFSSTTGWENHYQGDDTVIEWHSSVQLKTIAELVPPESNNCLVVGCGNSNLPRVLYNMRRHLFITCLDSSPTCIDQLRKMHGATTCGRMTFVCADALIVNLGLHSFDSMVDKGLVDALMCGEGWDGPVSRLFQNVGKVLILGGTYLLVSYKLADSTRELLHHVGVESGLSWEFDLEGSNNRVSISMARKIH